MILNYMKVPGKMIRLMGMEDSFIVTVTFILVNGKIIKWKVKVYLNGQMVENIWVNLKIMSEVVKEPLFGLLVKVI